MKLSRTYSPAHQRRVNSIRVRLERFLDRRGYTTVDMPLIEPTQLFLRKSGGELAAQMYSFRDPGGQDVSLRPEFTSSVVRSFVDGLLKGPLPQRWQYAGPVFRYEADGNRGEFEQLGAELLGPGNSSADAEVIALAIQGLSVLGIRGHQLRVGHMGVVAAMLEGLGLSERGRVFITKNLHVLRSRAESVDSIRERARQIGLLDPTDTHRFTTLARGMGSDDALDMVQGIVREGMIGAAGQRTPEEILRRYLKKSREVGAPQTLERALAFASELVALSGRAPMVRPRLAKLVKKYGIDQGVLQPVEELLESIGLYDLRGVPVILDLAAPRGIAYYTGVIFDIEHRRIKGSPSLGGGGRYDGLISALGGRGSVPAMGFAFTLERVAELLPRDFDLEGTDGDVRVLVTAQESSIAEAVATAERLRAQGIPAELDLEQRTDAEAARYAQQRGIQTIMRVGQDGVAERFI